MMKWSYRVFFMTAVFMLLTLGGGMQQAAARPDGQAPPPPEQESLQAKGMITAIRDTDGFKSIQLQGTDTRGFILHIADDTVIASAGGSPVRFADLRLGQQVEAEHALAMTASLPPQTRAYSITVMETGLPDVMATAGTIVKTQMGADGMPSLLIKGTGLTEASPDEVVLLLTADTLLVNPKGEALKVGDFVEGARVIGFYPPKLTKSLPPIGSAWKLVLEADGE